MLDDDAKREPFICDLEPLGIMIKSALQVVYGGGRPMRTSDQINITIDANGSGLVTGRSGKEL